MSFPAPQTTDVRSRLPADAVDRFRAVFHRDPTGAELLAHEHCRSRLRLRLPPHPRRRVRRVIAPR